MTVRLRYVPSVRCCCVLENSRNTWSRRWSGSSTCTSGTQTRASSDGFIRLCHGYTNYLGNKWSTLAAFPHTHTYVFLETNRKQGGCLIPLFYFTESSSRINISYKQIAFSFLSSISPHVLAVHVARLSVVTSQRLYTASIFYTLPEAFIQSRAAWSYGAEDPG